MRPVFEEAGRYFYINDSITTRGDGGTLNARPNLGYTVYYNPETSEKIAISDYDIELAKISNDEKQIYKHDQDLLDNGFVAIIPPKVRGKLGCWTWGLDKFNSETDNIIITGKKNKYAVKKRTFVDKDKIQNIDGTNYFISVGHTNSKSILEFSTNDGTNCLSEVMGIDGTFNNPKNLAMIKYLISLKEGKDYYILDFFAGSGTTGQAVLELNNEDGGNRKFILCTNNQNNICESVTYERIKTVITGKRKDGSIYKGIAVPSNLKYYKTEFVEKKCENISDALLEHIVEMIQLQFSIKLDNKRYVLILDDDELDLFEKNFSDYPDVKAVFINQDVLLTAKQEKLLKKIKTFIIPDYYFDFELRELGELW